jgi:hypothetical protein
MLDDADVTLSSGSLGAVNNVPVLVDARTVRITLGNGAAFAPGSTTLTLRSQQDAIRLVQGGSPAQTPPVTITLSDGARPAISNLTLDAVPNALNGRGPAGGLLQVPRNGFTIDAAYGDTSWTGPGQINTALTHVSTSRDFNAGGTNLRAGSNLFAALGGTAGPTSLSIQVPGNVEFQDGDQAMTVTCTDSSNNTSPPMTFNFRVRGINDDIRPFEGGQTWFLDIARDLDTISSSTPDAGQTINLSVVATPNGVSDFLEELTILGLRSPAPLAEVTPGKDSNQVALDILLAEVHRQLTLLYPGVSVVFTSTDPGAFPANRAFVGYRDASHSRIAIGAVTDAPGALGVALFDANNKNQENDTLPPGNYSNVVIQVRLGIFPHTLTDVAINVGLTLFRSTFDPFIDHRGTPIGEETTSDAVRLTRILSNTPGDARQTQMKTALDRFARFLAVLLAHECGHSLGLVRDGPMPAGLYGGSTSFPGSTPGHIALSGGGIFPPGAIEVMSPSLSFDGIVNAGTAFNPLLLAYLRERALYD